MHSLLDLFIQLPLLGIAIIAYTLILALSWYILNAGRPKPNRPHQHTPPKNPVAISLRFPRVPNVFDARTFREALAAVAGDSIVGLSWTKSAITKSTCTATVCFSSRPSFLQDFSKQSRSTTVFLESERGNAEVSADDHFDGMTPLYWSQDRLDADIVAVTGWNGKPFWSWKPENSPHMWLRDWLGKDLAENDCFARIFTYGYPATVANSNSDASYHDYGKTFLEDLVSIRRLQFKARQSRPLILIGHSLGGILIKQALKHAHSSTDDAERDIFQSCVGLFMFGVPNLGLENAALVTMTEGRKNESFARGLGKDSVYLPELEKDFSVAFRGRDIKAFAFYEREDSPSVEKKDGRWSRTGPLVRIVTRESACSLGISAESLPVLTNHSNLVKFSSQDDVTYQTVLRKTVDIINGKFAMSVHGAAQTTARLTEGSGPVNVPDHLSANFVGRTGIIQDIQTHLDPSTSNCSVFVLLGNGGMGKTQIALRYIKTSSEHSRRVFWIQADSGARMQESFRSIARALDISDLGNGTEVESQVLARLSTVRQPVLLVNDSVDSIDLVQLIDSRHWQKWQSSTAIKVLITTRNRQCLQLGPQVKHVVVGPLERQDSIGLLSASLLDSSIESFDNNSSIASICDELGCLPLGIQQASSYITVTGTLPQQYLKQLRQEPMHTLSFAKNWAEASIHRKTVLTVWEDSLGQIESTHPFAARLLCLCSFLGTEVPYSLFETAHEYLSISPAEEKQLSPAKTQIQWIFQANEVSSPWTASKLHLSIIELQNLSMAKTSLYGDGGTSLTLHGLVQQWLRLRLPLEKQKTFTSTAACLIYACAQRLQIQHKASADSNTAYLHQRHLLTHVYSCIGFCTQALGTDVGKIIPMECAVQFSNLLIHERQYNSAERMLRTCIQFAMQHSSSDVEEEIAALRGLSLALRRQRKYSEALLEQENALKKLTELGPEFRSVGQALRAEAELATIYRDLGKLEQALALQSNVVERVRHHFGESSLETLHEMSCLGVLQKKAGSYQRALETEKEIVRLFKEHFPARLELLDAMRSLAITYYYLDCDEKAIELELQVLAAKMRLYGHDHLETASAMQNLATSYEGIGAYQEAKQQYSEALRIRKAVLGDFDEKTRKTAKGLAGVNQLMHEEASPAIYMLKHDRRVDSGISVD